MSLVKHKVNGVDSINWYYRFNLKGKTYFSSTGTSNKAMAQKVEDRKRREAEEKVLLNKPDSITIAQALGKYVESKKSSGELVNIKTRVNKLMGSKTDTRNTRSSVAKITVYGFDSSRPFESLTDGDVQRLVFERRKEGNANGTILVELSTLSQTIKLIKRLGYPVPTIDFSAIKKGSEIKPAGGRLRTFSAEEEAALIVELDPETMIKGVGKADIKVQNQRLDVQDLVIAGFDTGARYSELAKLSWKQVDLKPRKDAKNGVIHLYRFKVNNESLIPISARLAVRLKRRLSEKRHDQTFVFEDSNGNSRNHATNAFNSACRRAGIEGVTFHTIRHTFASKLVVNEVPLYDVSQLLGHATVQMTARYAHLAPNQSFGKAIGILDQINEGAAA